MRFVDTNVLIYAISRRPDETDKQHRALAVLADSDLVLSVQVLQEFYTQATRPSRMGVMHHEESAAYIEALLRFPIQPLTLEVLHTALQYCQWFRLSYWDSAILAAAKISGCDTLLTEDLNPGQDYDGVRAINPFADLPTTG